MILAFILDNQLDNAKNVNSILPEFHLKLQCHEDFAVLGQFCAKLFTLRL